MNTSQKELYSQSEYLQGEAAFIEIQVHDKLRLRSEHLGQFHLHPDFDGFVTIHGEGETDGKRKILFSSVNQSKRQHYVRETTRLYSSVIHQVKPNSVKRVIVHPDTLDPRTSRFEHLINLADSLNEMNESLDTEVCVEPRGTDRHGKVLRNEMDDLTALSDILGSSDIGLCIDLAQLFVVHGNEGIPRFLEELKSIRLPVKEFHVSDVSQSKKTVNRVATEVGKGAIDWQPILPMMIQRCDQLLIETLGGIKVFQRSKSFLKALVRENEVLL